MKVTTQPYKGARDFYPEDKQLQNWMFDKWRRVVERYGYEEWSAPILEPTDLFLIKGNEEIINEQTYTFTDRGGRSVTIGSDLTPSTSRLVAGRRQELAYPARWYSIPNLWRYERMQRGRLREFWQLNVDLFGVSNVEAELEMLQIVDDLFQAFRAKRSSYTIKLNSRILVNILLIEKCGLDSSQTEDMIRLIDKLHKIPANELAVKATQVTGDPKITQQLIEILQTKNIQELPDEYQSIPSVIELTDIISRMKAYGVHNIEFDITLMRGFDYYTDVVFEVFDNDLENNRSMFGGGRYDGLVAQFGVDPVPTIGFGMGDVTFMDFLEKHKLLPNLRKNTEVILMVRDANLVDRAQSVARELREMGVNVAVDYSGRKIDKQFKSAMKSGIRNAIFVGQEELESEQFILKDLKTGKEEKHSLQRIVSMVKDSRK